MITELNVVCVKLNSLCTIFRGGMEDPGGIPAEILKTPQVAI